ncbi:MAG: hypothetical protein ABW140_16695 [Candidatus Sedimenticola sp. 6PFRAG1]
MNGFRCSKCGAVIESWRSKRPEFECPSCQQHFRSNYRTSLKRAVLSGVGFWAVGGISGCYFFGTWQKVLAVSIELGILAAFMVAVAVFRYSFSVEPQ